MAKQTKTRGDILLSKIEIYRKKYPKSHLAVAESTLKIVARARTIDALKKKIGLVGAQEQYVFIEPLLKRGCFISFT